VLQTFKLLGLLILAGVVVKAAVVMVVCAMAGDLLRSAKREAEEKTSLALGVALPISAVVVSVFSLRMVRSFSSPTQTLFFVALAILFLFSYTSNRAGFFAEILVYVAFLLRKLPWIVSLIWLVVGGIGAVVIVELAVTLFYFLPKAAYRVKTNANSAGLVFLFLRGFAYRCVALLLLVVSIRQWAFSHDRALALGMSVVLSVYGIYTALGKGRHELRIAFSRQAERYPALAKT